MNDEIKKINPAILAVILILIPLNQILLNYLIKARMFIPLAKSTDYWIQPTLVGNLISLLFFSLLIFVIGKLNTASVWLTKEKIKVAIVPVFMIWLIAQLITLAITYFNVGNVSFAENINLLAGSLISQLFGNAAFEELIYRGIIFLQLYLLLKNKITNIKALIISIIISQLIFSLIHIPNRLLLNQVNNLAIDLLGLFIAGVVLTLIFLRTQNLIFVIGAHALVNQPFNIIETTFPMKIIIYVLIIVTTIFWFKIDKSNTANYLFKK